jgi:hypothetical protein
MTDLNLEILSDIESMEFDPLGYVMYAFPWGVKGRELEQFTGPYAWQAKVLGEIGEGLRRGEELSEVVRKAVSSGHGIGKSALVSWIMLWGLSTKRDARGVVTANTEVQLRTKTWSELGKWHRLAINSGWFNYTATALASTDPRHTRTWRMDAVAWSEQRTESFAGLHNAKKRILLIFDEASAIPDTIWDVSEGALTDEYTQILWIAFGNPTRPTGRFSELFGRLAHRWDHQSIDARLVPGTNAKQHAEWLQDYGEDSDFFRVRVRGVFPRQAAWQFISSETVAKCRATEAHCDMSDPLILGVDVARFGTNESVIFSRRGRDARNWGVQRYQKMDTMALANEVVKAAHGEHRADAVFIDEGGVGGGVVDRCRQLGLDVIGIHFGGKPDMVAMGTGRSRYLNKRTQMWGEMRDWLESGGAIPDDDALGNQLIAPEYSMTTRDEIALERKQDMEARGQPSPDIGDALALTFAAPVVSSQMEQATGYGDIETDWEPW